MYQLLTLLALAIGAMFSVYLPMIAQSARILGSGALANVPFFAVGMISSVVIAYGTGVRLEDYGKLASVPPVLFTAGIMSAGMIMGSSFLVPRVGIGVYFVLLVAGQILASLIFGYFGLFGVPPTPLTWGKVSGAVLVISGVWLVTFR